MYPLKFVFGLNHGGNLELVIFCANDFSGFLASGGGAFRGGILMGGTDVGRVAALCAPVLVFSFNFGKTEGGRLWSPASPLLDEWSPVNGFIRFVLGAIPPLNGTKNLFWGSVSMYFTLKRFGRACCFVWDFLMARRWALGAFLRSLAARGAFTPRIFACFFAKFGETFGAFLICLFLFRRGATGFGDFPLLDFRAAAAAAARFAFSSIALATLSDIL